MRLYWCVVTRHRRATFNETLNNTVTQFAFHRKIMLLETWYSDRVSVNRIFFLNRAGCVIIAREWSFFHYFYSMINLSCRVHTSKHLFLYYFLSITHGRVNKYVIDDFFFDRAIGNFQSRKENAITSKIVNLLLHWIIVCVQLLLEFLPYPFVFVRAYSYTVYGRRVSARSSQLEGLLKDVLSNSVAIKR